MQKQFYLQDLLTPSYAFLHKAFVQNLLGWGSCTMWPTYFNFYAPILPIKEWACDLCLTEKVLILTADQHSVLKKKDGLLETCKKTPPCIFIYEKETLWHYCQVTTFFKRYFKKLSIYSKFNSNSNPISNSNFPPSSKYISK